jgi:hypothetical protein
VDIKVSLSDFRRIQEGAILEGNDMVISQTNNGLTIWAEKKTSKKIFDYSTPMEQAGYLSIASHKSSLPSEPDNKEMIELFSEIEKKFVARFSDIDGDDCFSMKQKEWEEIKRLHNPSKTMQK